jgi:hypothetical protein
MHPTLLFFPRLHGALGWWDELINLIPLVVGIVLVLYLYRASRQRRDADGDATPAAPEPDAHPDTSEAPVRHS